MQAAQEQKENEIHQVKEDANAKLIHYSSIINVDEAIKQRELQLLQLQGELASFNNKYQEALAIHNNLEKEIQLYTDDLELIEYGVYKPQFNFDTSEEYKYKLERNYEMQKQLIKLNNYKAKTSS